MSITLTSYSPKFTLNLASGRCNIDLHSLRACVCGKGDSGGVVAQLSAFLKLSGEWFLDC